MKQTSTGNAGGAGGPDFEEIRRRLRKTLSERRYRHIENVVNYSKDMAEKWGVDPEKAETAALLHDYKKNKDLENNDVLHGALAADAIREEFGIEDEDILNAVRYHTTGRRGMSKLELIIFLSDTLEPGRKYPGVDWLREETDKDLYRGALIVLKELKGYLYKKSIDPVSDTIEAIEWLEDMDMKGEF